MSISPRRRWRRQRRSSSRRRLKPPSTRIPADAPPPPKRKGDGRCGGHRTDPDATREAASRPKGDPRRRHPQVVKPRHLYYWRLYYCRPSRCRACGLRAGNALATTIGIAQTLTIVRTNHISGAWRRDITTHYHQHPRIKGQSATVHTSSISNIGALSQGRDREVRHRHLTPPPSTGTTVPRDDACPSLWPAGLRAVECMSLPQFGRWEAHSERSP